MRRTSITVCPERCGAEGNPAVSRKARAAGVPSIHGKKFCQLKTFFVNYFNNQNARPKTTLFGKRPQFAANLRLNSERVNAAILIIREPQHIAAEGNPVISRKARVTGFPSKSRKKVLSAQNFFRELKYTINTATSAGLTPEMRPACPRFSGRILFSFCRASRRSPSMLS